MRAGRFCPEHEKRYDDCSFIHGERDLRALVSLDWTKVIDGNKPLRFTATTD